MLKRVRIADPGDSDFLVGEHVDKLVFAEVNQALFAENKKRAAGGTPAPGNY